MSESVTVDTFQRFMRTSLPGESLTYYHGWLAVDLENPSRDLAEMINYVRLQYNLGRIELVQKTDQADVRKIGGKKVPQHTYIAIKRRTVGYVNPDHHIQMVPLPEEVDNDALALAA